jgi:acyl-CoA thioesterase-1
MKTVHAARFALVASVLFLGLVSMGPARAQDGAPTPAKPLKLAFIGASITAGVGTVDPHRDAYPYQLARMLGPSWDVRDFGVSGTTLLHDGDNPYVKTPSYQQALAFRPDILVIDLGGNDSKPQNFEAHPGDFVPDYAAMVAAFRAVNPAIKIYAALPVPAFPDNYGIRESVLEQKIIPAVRKAVVHTHISCIDFHTPMLDKGADFHDRVHPNEAGARALAEIACQALKADYPGR